MSDAEPRRRSTRRVGLAVTVTTPDSSGVSARGLAAWLKKAAPAKARGEVTIALVSDGRMQTLNRTFRGKDYATDVLSFPTTNDQPTANDRRQTTTDKRRPTNDKRPTTNETYLGDIVIATGVAQRQADEAGHPLSTELKVLALHGLLHLLGYDHEVDDGLMSRTEAKLRKKAGLKEGLIARSNIRSSPPTRKRARRGARSRR